MKVSSKDNVIVRGGSTGVEKTFSIANNAMAFEILSGNIYTDIPSAIVRELGTNAYDAHVEAGNQSTPFDLQLPNTITPVFRIRDYGTGLSTEGVETTYTTYFSSTRRNSNDFVGAKGLGSKTPFAYCDLFDIISYYHGKKYTYCAFKNEEGAPTLTLMHEADTSEPNGLEIKINIREADINNFIGAATKIYRHFEVKPNITGSVINFEMSNDTKLLLEGSNYKLYKTGYYNSDFPGKINVIMGQVCYTAKCSNTNIGSDATLVLYANIGECSVVASREELQYDDKTNQFLTDAINKAKQDARVQIQGMVDQTLCMLDRQVQLAKYKNIVDIGNTSNIPLNSKDKYNSIYLRLVGGKLKYGNDWYNKTIDASSLKDNFVVLFIENDTDNKVLSQKNRNKIRQYLENEIYNKAYLVTIEDRKAFTDNFGDRSVKLSTLPEVVRKKADNVAPRTYVKQMNMGYCRRLYEAWHNLPEEIDTAGACCVPKDGQYVWWRGDKYRVQSLQDIATLLGYKTVYGVARSRLKKFQAEYNLPNLEDEAKKKAIDIGNNLDPFALSKDQYDSFYIDPNVQAKLDGLSEACTNMIKVCKADSIGCTQMSLMNMFNITIPKGIDYSEEFYNTYPLLRQVERFTLKTIDDILEYIELKENK